MRLSSHLFRYEDTCHVYGVRTGREAVLIDFGSGDVLDHLAEFGVERVTDILVTHHHRDQVQGLARAVAAGIRIWVPPVERDLIEGIDDHWQERSVRLDYNTRQDRFSLLRSVPITGVLPEYRAPRFGGRPFRVLPTPGHTVGSVSLLTRVDGRKVAFTGDLVHSPGRLWSLAATQWTYTGAEGAAATVLSLLDLRDRRPDALLPSHGEPMEDPVAAIDTTVARLDELFAFRGRHGDLHGLRSRPYEVITPHLLSNRTSVSNSYVLRSDSGKALLIDFGYDFTTGLAAGADRAGRRPWLVTMGQLSRQHGVRSVDVAIPTHYHDDHLAGFGLLQDVMGTRLWIPESFHELLADPDRYGVPCLWFDPIRADDIVPLGQPVPWEEYQLRFWPLPGHTEWAVAIEVEVDGVKVLATGDHQQDRWLNYTYANRFRMHDFVDSAELYQRLEPDLIISGHWAPIWSDPTYLSDLAQRGRTLERLHRELLPLDEVDFEAGGLGAWIEPYVSRVQAGTAHRYEVHTRNPWRETATVAVTLDVPDGWAVTPDRATATAGPLETVPTTFTVVPPEGCRARRARIGADVTWGARRFGQLAEALVDVSP